MSSEPKPTTDALPPFSDDELAAIRERSDKATPGPWRVRMWGGTNQESPEPPEWTIEGSDGYRVRAEDCYPGDGRDVYFIAHSREDVPRLIATIAERDRTITRLQAIEARAKEQMAYHDKRDDAEVTTAYYTAKHILEGSLE